MAAAHFERVWQQMIQMFGPQWTEKWGVTNETWADALKELSYPQVTEGLKRVRNGSLKFYELDLPNFMQLCRPVVPLVATKMLDRVMPAWSKEMQADEIALHQFACMRFLIFLIGSPALEQAQVDACVKSLHRLAREFYDMRKELGADKVPDEDLKTALTRQWRRDINAGVSA